MLVIKIHVHVEKYVHVENIIYKMCTCWKNVHEKNVHTSNLLMLYEYIPM